MSGSLQVETRMSASFIGWRRTVALCGGVGSALTTLRLPHETAQGTAAPGALQTPTVEVL